MFLFPFSIPYLINKLLTFSPPFFLFFFFVIVQVVVDHPEAEPEVDREAVFPEVVPEVAEVVLEVAEVVLEAVEAALEAEEVVPRAVPVAPRLSLNHTDMMVSTLPEVKKICL